MARNRQSRDISATNAPRSPCRTTATLLAESFLLSISKTEAALGAWLDTIAADTTRRPASLTLRPEEGSRQPLLQAFSELGKTSSAAPLQVKGTLAEGGMGLIRLAEQEALGRTVVVKTLRENYAAQAAEHVLREAWATGALEHPNIVPVHDIRVDDNGAPLIVLKRIEGLSWTELMADADAVQERFGESNLLEWNLEILGHVIQAIRFAHSKGILHRDLKPDNVMIGAFGEVYLVDWGIALSLPVADESRLPAAADSDGMAGTPCYMAPEMLGGAPLDERTDTYLLGAVLYEILSGEPPHRSTTLGSLIGEIKISSPPPPTDACPRLTALALRAMAGDPNNRFQDATEFARALDACLEQRESMRLADVAAAQHEKMDALLRSPEPSRHECYRLFGALRLGYIESLRVWGDNREAQVALDAARVQVIEFELDQGNPHAAQSIFAELAAPPESLGSRIEEAQCKQREELAELGQYRDDSNFALGSRTRIFLISILGMLWTITPLLRYTWRFESLLSNYLGMAAITSFFMLFTIGLWYWARETLSKTLINRRFSLALLTLFPCQFLLFAAGSMMEMSVVQAQQLMLFVWTMVSAGVVAGVDLRFLPAAIGYAAAFLIAAKYPEARFLAMSAGNAVLTVTAVVLWYPKPGDYETGMLSRRPRKLT